MNLDEKLKNQLSQVFERHANAGKQLDDLRNNATELGELLYEIATIYSQTVVPSNVGTVNFMAGSLNIFFNRFLNALNELGIKENKIDKMNREQISFVLILQTYLSHLEDIVKTIPEFQKEKDLLKSKMERFLTDTKGNIL